MVLFGRFERQCCRSVKESRTFDGRLLRVRAWLAYGGEGDNFFVIGRLKAWVSREWMPASFKSKKITLLARDFSLRTPPACPTLPGVRVTLSLCPCYPLASQFIGEVHLMRGAFLAILFLL